MTSKPIEGYATSSRLKSVKIYGLHSPSYLVFEVHFKALHKITSIKQKFTGSQGAPYFEMGARTS